jgi:hypothetical protein
MVSITFPFLKTRNVGMLWMGSVRIRFRGPNNKHVCWELSLDSVHATYAETPYWLVMSELASVSTLTNASLPGALCEVASCSKTGAIALHGPVLRQIRYALFIYESKADAPHQVALKSTITDVLEERAFWN